jgi:hypothetical protein
MWMKTIMMDRQRQKKREEEKRKTKNKFHMQNDIYKKYSN